MDATQSQSDIYTDGTYLEKTGGTWHLQDSPSKAQEIAKLLARRRGIQPDTVCEIGCGAGGILAYLQKTLPSHVVFTGYEISPQAHSLSARFANSRCRFVLGDAFADSITYDLVLIMDVVEHVEDCFSFLRLTRRKGRYKLYHIPLDTSVNKILRGVNSWDSLGHIHLFTKETALKSLEHTGHQIIDWTFTAGTLASPGSRLARMGNLVRWPLDKLSVNFCSRLMGGYSILILAA